jgi:disulfide bond formation protein DsbB
MMTEKNTIKFLLFASFSALFAAYVSQYFFGLKPCILCLYQRIPFFLIILSCLIGFFIRREKIIIYFSFLLLLINSGIAFYHAGIEYGVFELTQKCVTSMQDFSSIEEMKEFLAKQSISRCDEVQFRFLGLSMAVWNAFFCLGIFAFLAIFQKKQ